MLETARVDHRFLARASTKKSDSDFRRLGFNAFRPEWRRQRGGVFRRPLPFRLLTRRSGRIPAFPYPLVRCVKPSSSCVGPFCGYYGSEFAGRAMESWAMDTSVHLCFVRPGRPAENSYMKSFNGRLRDECLNVEWIRSLNEAREKLTRWRDHYNQCRPHSALDDRTPAAFASLHRTGARRFARSQRSLLSLWSDLQARETGSGGP